MKHPFESLPLTVLMGVALTCIMVIIMIAIY
jgi:hypothetical protein